MTKEELVELGFKIKKSNGEYWYELKYKHHLFLTNDTLNNRRKDQWFIGYQNIEQNEDFWFNQNLSTVDCFTTVFFVLIGKVFQPRKKITRKFKTTQP